MKCVLINNKMPSKSITYQLKYSEYQGMATQQLWPQSSEQFTAFYRSESTAARYAASTTWKKEEWLTEEWSCLDHSIIDRLWISGGVNYVNVSMWKKDTLNTRFKQPEYSDWYHYLCWKLKISGSAFYILMF